MNKENKIKYVEALGNLMGGIKEDYKNWGSDINDLDEPQKSIRLRMIDEFNKNLDIQGVDACIMTVDKVKVFGIIQASMDIEQAKSAQLALKSKYFIPTGIAPSRTKGLISYILSIKEFNSETDLLPTVCREVGDTLSI